MEAALDIEVSPCRARERTRGSACTCNGTQRAAREHSTHDARDEHEDAQAGERKQLVEFHQAEDRQARRRQPLRNFPGDGDAKGWQAEQCRQRDRQRHHRQPDRPARQPALAQQQQQDRNGADQQHRPIDLAKLTRQPDRPIEEVVAAARDAQQTRQLAGDDGEPGGRIAQHSLHRERDAGARDAEARDQRQQFDAQVLQRQPDRFTPFQQWIVDRRQGDVLDSP